tara:strand:+ start:464 stop:880 length:417 start_codon:yes stop_codon:yes gene_type:complete
MKKFFAPLIVLALLVSSCSSKKATTPKKYFFDEMHQYSKELVAKYDTAISTPSYPKRTTDMPSYFVTYVIEDDAIKTRSDASSNSVSFAINSAITKRWGDMFCTSELKSIMKMYGVVMVGGQLLDKDGVKHSLTTCMQ